MHVCVHKAEPHPLLGLFIEDMDLTTHQAGCGSFSRPLIPELDGEPAHAHCTYNACYRTKKDKPSAWPSLPLSAHLSVLSHCTKPLVRQSQLWTARVGDMSCSGPRGKLRSRACPCLFPSLQGVPALATKSPGQRRWRTQPHHLPHRPSWLH